MITVETMSSSDVSITDFKYADNINEARVYDADLWQGEVFDYK